MKNLKKITVLLKLLLLAFIVVCCAVIVYDAFTNGAKI